MNGTGLLQILRYMLCWQPILSWIVAAGLLVLLLAPVVAVLIDSHTAYGVTIYGYAAALATPYLAATVPFRNLISSRRLALVPGLQVRAGVALLLLTVLLACLLPLSSALLWPGILHPQLGFMLFIVASLFSALMQWVIASRFMMLLLSFGPFLFFFALAVLRNRLGVLLEHPVVMPVLAATCLLGWGLALRVLAGRRHFNPIYRTPFNNSDHMLAGTFWPAPSGLGRGRVKSSAGTLLLAYPDGLPSRLYYTLNLVVISPCLAVLCLYLIGFSGYGQNNSPSKLVELFLLFSMITAILSSMGNGELAARCRLLWMREGGDRHQQWRLLERTMSTNLLLLWIVVLVIGVGSMPLLDASRLTSADYMLVSISCSLLGSYFSLVGRIAHWSMFMQMVMVGFMGPGLAAAVLQDTVPLPVLSAVLVLAALLLRSYARRRFARIDWQVVKPRTTARAENPA